MLVAHAPAKVNLSLEVVGRREDGYHELVSVMQTVTLVDRLRLAPSKDLILTCSDPLLSTDENLVVRAANLLRSRYAITDGCSMSLEKRVPVAAGLGGGSSDGAAALTQLSRLWKVPAGCADLLPMAEELGSDVPFFLYGGTALVEGRGEQVTPLPQPTSVWYLLVKPPFSVSTARVFAALPECEWTDGEKTRRLASDIRSRGRATLGVNSLQETLFRLYPEAQVCFEAVADLAPGQTLVSGSGPTVAASFPSREEAQRAAAGLAGRGFWMETVTPCSIEAWQAPCA